MAGADDAMSGADDAVVMAGGDDGALPCCGWAPPCRLGAYGNIWAAVAGLDGNHAGKAYRDLMQQQPEVHLTGVNFKFPPGMTDSIAMLYNL